MCHNVTSVTHSGGLDQHSLRKLQAARFTQAQLHTSESITETWQFPVHRTSASCSCDKITKVILYRWGSALLLLFLDVLMGLHSNKGRAQISSGMCYNMGVVGTHTHDKTASWVLFKPLPSPQRRAVTKCSGDKEGGEKWVGAEHKLSPLCHFSEPQPEHQLHVTQNHSRVHCSQLHASHTSFHTLHFFPSPETKSVTCWNVKVTHNMCDRRWHITISAATSEDQRALALIYVPTCTILKKYGLFFLFPFLGFLPIVWSRADITDLRSSNAPSRLRCSTSLLQSPAIFFYCLPKPVSNVAYLYDGYEKDCMTQNCLSGLFGGRFGTNRLEKHKTQTWALYLIPSPWIMWNQRKTWWVRNPDTLSAQCRGHRLHKGDHCCLQMPVSGAVALWRLSNRSA